jgi:cytosine/uracil/thiamine/allantoin permease
VAGIESIRILLNIKAPLLIVLGLILLGWAYRAAGGFGPMLSQPSAFDPGQLKAGQFWKVFWPALTGNIAFWATPIWICLNIEPLHQALQLQGALLSKSVGHL